MVNAILSTVYITVIIIVKTIDHIIDLSVNIALYESIVNSTGHKNTFEDMIAEFELRDTAATFTTGNKQSNAAIVVILL
jgi:hypothetical protein